MPPLELPAAAVSLARPGWLGLDGPECRERAGLDQGYGRVPPGQRCCCRCGRVTHRVDAAGPWCGGEAT